MPNELLAGLSSPMSLRYLPEHAELAWLALELARKEVAHLRYSHRTLFAQPIDAIVCRRVYSLALATRPAIPAFRYHLYRPKPPCASKMP
jgi:hypothetical protein